jgi:hypothetical protein
VSIDEVVLAEKWEWNGTRRSRRSPSFPDLQDSQGTQMELEKELGSKICNPSTTSGSQLGLELVEGKSIGRFWTLRFGLKPVAGLPAR